ncbi:hypothetical protein [Mesonia sp. K7]|uniref:hypothetical protein n=1 Tax=Mesonia sp. K7 TaxID=2218606 RepID=UPI000DA7D5D5|nr:hypothetical protein [Mesonia sp. K7]PZD77314.1 hypothetical protein DNG35_09600 [Mesonia sp. K7]
MKELDLLKKEWQKQDESLPKYKADELYKMLLKKSSSIVKWIFYISIIELGLGFVLNLFLADKEYWELVEGMHLTTFTYVLYAISYIITFAFIIAFYKRYQKISAVDSARELMQNILKTRRVVKYYIGFMLLSMAVSFMIYYLFTSTYLAEINQKSINMWAVILFGLAACIIFIGVIWLIYTLVYGLLLRKLKRNYKELKRLEL